MRVCFFHICCAPKTGNALWWPIVGRNDNCLYLVLQRVTSPLPSTSLFSHLYQRWCLQLALPLFSSLPSSVTCSLTDLLYLCLFSPSFPSFLLHLAGKHHWPSWIFALLSFPCLALHALNCVKLATTLFITYV